MSNKLIDTIRQISATGPDGFEGLIAKLLKALTGRNFYLAKSGYQAGRDLSIRDINVNVVAVECKRYGSKTELDETHLLGKLVQAVGDFSDLDLWLLVTSRDVDSKLHQALYEEAHKQGIEFLSISHSGENPSSLEVLCAQAPEVVLTFLETKISEEEKENLQQQLDKIAASPQFDETVERIREAFLSPLVGYDNWRLEQNQWFLKCLQSEAEAHANFGQPLNVEDNDIKLVNREAVWAKLDEWFSTWHETCEPFVALGEEGDGKTWGVASWLSQKIKNAKNFPPVIFLSSTQVNTNDNPLTLLSDITSSRQHIRSEDYWKARILRWVTNTSGDTPILILILDGINERRGRTWWRTLLEKLRASLWSNSVAVLITCRTAYWQPYFDELRHLPVRKYIIPPYSDVELDNALSFHNLRRSDIAEAVLPLIRKPRYFDLMIKHHALIAESGDVTPARLVYEDWRDRYNRKNHIDLDNDEFQELLRELTIKHQQGHQNIREQDIDAVLSLSLDDRRAVFEELRTGGVLQRIGNQYRVDERMLIHGFGLLLVDQLVGSGGEDRDFEQILAEWLEPYKEMDLKASICGFAALHGLSLPELPREAKVVLLSAWVNSRNLEPEVTETFPAYFPLDPSCYIGLAEQVWSARNENSWAQELLMNSFLQWYEKSPRVASELNSTFERWLGFVNLYGFSYQRGEKMQKAEKVRQEIFTRIGRELQPGPFTFANYSLTATNDDGLMRLGRVALAVISHLPRAPFIRAITTGCVAEAVMGTPHKYDLFKWVIITASHSLWNEIKKEVEQLLAIDHIVTKQAAYRLLSFEGSADADQLQQTLPQNLFSTSPIFEAWRKNPCTAPTAWTQDHCRSCLQRSDLSLHWIAKRLKPHCVDPDLEIPDDLRLRLRPLIDTIPIRSIWSAFSSTGEDLEYEDYEPVFCANAPDAIARFVRRIASQIDIREGLPLRQLTFKLIQHSLILNEEEQRKIYQTWKQLYDNDVWDKTKKETEMFLFISALKALMNSEGQLIHLLSRPDDAPDLLKYKPSFLPMTDWGVVWTELTKTSDARAIGRILWFLSAHPKAVPIDAIRTRILPLLNHGDSYVRSLVLQILYFSRDNVAIKLALDGGWAWNTESNEEVENIWGSLLLCEHGTNISYSELRSRVHPIYLGYAIQCRGMKTDEVDQYAQDIHRFWSHLGSSTQAPPIDLPPIKVDASYDGDVTLQDRRKISQDLRSHSTKLFMRDFSWGGIEKNDFMDFFENLTSVDNQQEQDLLQLMHQVVKEQIDAGNVWFARNFHTNTLDQVVHRRPELVNEWWGNAFDERPEAIRRLYLSRSFYDALCIVLLNEMPDKGLKLYWRLKEKNIGVLVIDHNTKIQLLDYALFKVPDTIEARNAWHRKIEQCQTDRELMETAILAQFGNGRDWLWSYVKDGVHSTIPLEKSRAMTLLAFIETDEAYNLLNTLLDDSPDTWVRQLIKLSLQRWQANDWAKYWFHRFLSCDDDVVAWASFRLFLQCADTRFWHWEEQIKTKIEVDEEVEKRWIFFEDNMDTINNRIRKNEQELKKHYLGQKILNRQAWPWM